MALTAHGTVAMLMRYVHTDDRCATGPSGWQAGGSLSSLLAMNRKRRPRDTCPARLP